MIVASYVLHYGAEYLAWSIRSIQDAVDEIQVFYTSVPSFGHVAKEPCPETEEALREQAFRFLKPGKKLIWVSGSWSSEGGQRDDAVAAATSRGAKQILVVDADEIWDPEALDDHLLEAREKGVRTIHARFVHFWRSFNWCCTDPSMPIRIYNVDMPEGHGYLSPGGTPVLHMGYAQSEALTRYKISIHGHLAEWRPGWLSEKFLPWTPGPLQDAHPTCSWNPETKVFFWDVRPVDPEIRSAIERTLFDHPYRSREVIR